MLSKRRGRKYKLFRKCLLNKKKETSVVYNQHHVACNAGKIKLCDVLSSYYCIISPRDSAILTQNQLEACRKIVARRIRRIKPKASYYSPLTFTLPLTTKSKNSRMGKGKGKFSSFIARVKAMEPIFVLRNVPIGCAIGLANKMRHKLPVDLTVGSYTYGSAGNTLFSTCSFNTLNKRFYYTNITHVSNFCTFFFIFLLLIVCLFILCDINVIYAAEEIDLSTLDIDALRRGVLNTSNYNLDILDQPENFPKDCDTALYYMYVLSADLEHVSGIIRVTTDWNMLSDNIPTAIRCVEMMERLYAVCLEKKT